MGQAAIKVTTKWQFTVPKRIRSQLTLKPGDYLEPEVKEGVLLLKPRRQILIDPDQAWFWSEEWQAKEEEVEEEIRKGKTNLRKNHAWPSLPVWSTLLSESRKFRAIPLSGKDRSPCITGSPSTKQRPAFSSEESERTIS